jgi:hypothetical protein
MARRNGNPFEWEHKMTSSKLARKAFQQKHGQDKDWPLVVYIWIFGLTILSYLVARVALDGMPHPYHWGSALVGGLIGIPVGWLWYRWRGDVF